MITYSKTKFVFLITILLSVIPVILKAQTDTEFWFGAPDISNSPNWGTLDEPIYIRISTLSQAATITVSMPSDPTFISITKVVTANSTYSFNLTSSKGKLETPPDKKANGIKVSSDVKIEAYYEVANKDNPEIFSLKGIRGMGTHFFVPLQTVTNNANDQGFTPEPTNGFVIVATEDNTNVTITPTKALTGGHTAGLSYTITLNKGQTYCGSGAGVQAANHPSGTEILANKNISVTTYDDLIKFVDGGNNGADLMGDQLVSVDFIGTDYIAVPTSLCTSGEVPFKAENVFIVATEDGTDVFKNGIKVITLNKGKTYTMPINSATVIKTSKPAYAYQMSGMGLEAGGSLLPAIGCSGSKQVSITRSDGATDNPIVVILITKQGAENGYTIKSTKGTFKPSDFFNSASSIVNISGTNYVCTAFLDWGDQNAKIPNNTAFTVTNNEYFQCAFYQGFRIGGCRFGYFSDYSGASSVTKKKVYNNCELTLNATSGLDSYLWSTNEITSSIKSKNQDTVWVKGKQGACDIIDTFLISHYSPRKIRDTTVCYGKINLTYDAATFDSKPPIAKSYHWTGNKTTELITIIDTGKYYIKLTDEANCFVVDTFRVKYLTISSVTFNPLPDVCIDTAAFILSGGFPSGGKYAGTGIGIDSLKFNPATAGAGKHTIFYVYNDPSGCKAIAQSAIQIDTFPAVDLGNGQTICEGKSVFLSAGDANLKYKWSNNDTTNAINVKPVISTIYTVTVKQGKCEKTDNVKVEVINLVDPIFTLNPKIACAPMNVFMSDQSSFSGVTYSWDLGDGNISNNSELTHIYDKPGKYIVKLLVEKYGCKSNPSIDTVKVLKKPQAHFVYNPLNPTNFAPDVNFTDISSNDVISWQWDFGDSLVTDDLSNQQNPTYRYTCVGNKLVVLEVENSNGCIDRDTVNLYVNAEYTFFAPNAFSPQNEDGINDVFIPIGAGISENNYEFTVYSRWGEEIFHTTKLNDPWDGRTKNKSKVYPQGVYLWRVIFNDSEGKKHQFTGGVVLVE